MFDILQSPLLFIPLSLLLAYFQGREQLKRTALFSLLAGILSLTLKFLYNVSRTCPAGVDCYTSLAFPSGHAALAFSVAFSFYPTPLFLPTAIYAIFVSVARIFFGAHTFTEVMAGYALSLFIFLLFHRGKKFKGQENEILRQSSHVFIGLLFALLFAFAKDVFLLVLFAGSLTLLYYSAYVAGTIPFLRPIERIFERNAPFFGYGALNFLTGMLLLATYVMDEHWALAGMLILSLADGFSTIIGKYLGRHKLIEGKSLEGTATFFFIAYAVALFLGIPALPVALATTLAEFLSRPLKVDDNLSICLIIVALWWLVKHIGF